MLFPITTPGGSSGQLQYHNSGVFGGAAALVYATSGTHLTATAQAATDVVALFKAAGSQSANLVEWRNSGNTLKARFTSALGFHAAGDVTETADASNPGVYLGFAGGTPRVVWKDASSSVGQVDLDSSVGQSFRVITAGGVRMHVGNHTTKGGGASFEKCVINGSSLADLESLIRAYSRTGNTSVRAFVGLGETGQTAALFAGRLYSSTSTARDVWDAVVTWATSTDASRKGRTVFNIYDTAAREALRLEASGSAAMIGFLGATASVRQTGGENVTNNVTAGGTTGTIADYSDLTTYANDAAAIRNNLYQLARLVKQDHDALRLYGLLT